MAAELLKVKVGYTLSIRVPYGNESRFTMIESFEAASYSFKVKAAVLKYGIESFDLKTSDEK